MTDTTGTPTSGWRDRWIWVFLAVTTLVFVAVAARGWWTDHSDNQRVVDQYTCAIDPSSDDDC